MPRTASSPNLRDGLRLKLWRSMRMLRRFTVRELVKTSGASPSHAHRYVQGLERFEYLQIERQGGPGAGQSVYRLARDTGPRPPVVLARFLGDGNLHQRIGFNEDGELAVLGEWWR